MRKKITIAHIINAATATVSEKRKSAVEYSSNSPKEREFIQAKVCQALAKNCADREKAIEIIPSLLNPLLMAKIFH